jgi:hypothetical protein
VANIVFHSLLPAVAKTFTRKIAARAIRPSGEKVESLRPDYGATSYTTPPPWSPPLLVVP